MNINKKIKKDSLIYPFIFFSFLIIGLNSFKDYGVSIDENFHVTNGEHYYSFFKGLFFSNEEFITLEELKKSFKDHYFKDPAIFDFSVSILVDIFNIQDIKDIYLLRHLLIFLIFLLGVFYFYLILRKRFKSNLIIILGLLFIFLSPRIFANSFYNNKDLIFLSISCIFFYYSIEFFEKPSLRNSIIFAIITALAFDIRIMALIYIFVFYLMLFLHFLDDKNFLNQKLKNYFFTIILTILFIYLFWPYLWIDPINNLIDYFLVIKDEIPSMQNLYLGNYVFSKSLPWHYEMIWILITSPLTIIIFFLIGYPILSVKIFNNLIEADKKDHRFWKNNNEFIDLYLFLAFTLTFLVKIKFGVNYGGWRQIYYLYPLIVILGLCGLEYIFKLLKNKKVITFLFVLLFSELIFLSLWSYKNHPYQFVYFNPIFKKFVKNNFDLDYWGISNKSVLEKIFLLNKEESFKVTTNSFTNLNDSLRLLDPKLRKKINIVYDLNQADYVLDNHMKKWSSTPGEENLQKDFSVFYNLIIDGNIINTVYKRN